MQEVSKRLVSLVSKGLLRKDARQSAVALRLDSILQSAAVWPRELEAWRRLEEERRRRAAEGETTTSNRHAEATQEEKKLEKPPPPTGAFLHGSVGTGKTMLMDMLAESAKEQGVFVRRIHMNEASYILHRTLGRFIENTDSNKGSAAVIAARRRQLQARGKVNIQHTQSSLLVEAALDLMGGQEGRPGLFLLDEFQVPDTFTSLALKGLFEVLWEHDNLIVTTSNRSPDESITVGLGGDHLENLLPLLNQHCPSLDLDTNIDYRQVLLDDSLPSVGREAVVFQSNEEGVDDLWERLPGEETKNELLAVSYGRSLEVPLQKVGPEGKVGRFKFPHLCEEVLGPSDFMFVANNFDALFIEDVPVLTKKTADSARRLITLIDELYNGRTGLIISSNASVDDLFHDENLGKSQLDLEGIQFESEPEGGRLRRSVTVDGGVAPIGGVNSSSTKQALRLQLSGEEEKFAFKRAVSRLKEMQSVQYLKLSKAAQIMSAMRRSSEGGIREKRGTAT